MATTLAPDYLRCPRCGSIRLNCNGHNRNNKQRYLCKNCGFRPSALTPKKIFKIESNIDSISQICASEAKNLDNAIVPKTVAGVTETSLIGYAWKLKKKGRRDSTIRTRCSVLADLTRKGADLSNPDTVETILAVEPEYNNPEKPSKRHLAIMAYQSYCKIEKIYWEKIKDDYQPKDAFIATEDELKLYINSAGHQLGTYLLVTHDIGGRRGEVASLKFSDVNTANHTISINRPEKNSRPRTITVPEATIARIQTLERKYYPYIFCPNPRTFTDQFEGLRRKVCRDNPYDAERLKQIHIHTFRYAFAHRLIKQQKHLKEVQQKMGHKSSASTDRYTNTVVFNDSDWEIARATTPEEAEELGHKGYAKYDEFGNVHLYRRIKS